MKRLRKTLPILLLLMSCAFARDGGEPLSLSSIFKSSTFSPATIDGLNLHWAADGKSFYFLAASPDGVSFQVLQYDVTSQKTTAILDDSNFSGKLPGSWPADGFVQWSNDDSRLLLTGTLRARDIKTGGNFFLFDRNTGSFKQLTKTDATQLNIRFSPDGNKIGFVRNNNLFVLDTRTGEENQLTSDGSENILNGHFDWVYEEEFGIIEGWSWSDDGKKIAFWRIDQTAVPSFEISEYDSLHLNFIRMKYPKPGDPNSTVRIGVVDVQTGDTRWMDTGSDVSQYIPRVYWVPGSERLGVVQINRLQNRVTVRIADANTGKSRKILEESSDTWIKIRENMVFVPGTDRWIWMSERDGWNHLYLYDLDGKLIRSITGGNWEVRTIEGVDAKNNHVYFMGTKDGPLENQLYRAPIGGGPTERVTEAPGWHKVSLSPGFDFFLDEYSQSEQPDRIGLFGKDGAAVSTFSDAAWTAVQDIGVQPREFIQVKTPDGTQLNAWILKPPDFEPEKKYPLIMTVYGGPGSQRVVNRFRKDHLWHQFLVREGFIVACVDNRGTGGRGAAFEKIVYKNLGKWEVQDQIDAARFFGSLNYIDAKRIGIFGWSYGGYMSSFCLFKGNDVFKSAVAVAPVTHWKFYDTIYTERYMQTPKQNPDGYETGSPINYAAGLKGAFLLVHGTSDDNVHLQNSMALSNALIAAGKQFRTMFYPGRFHSIRKGSKNTQEHVYTLITDFFKETLQ